MRIQKLNYAQMEQKRSLQKNDGSKISRQSAQSPAFTSKFGLTALGLITALTIGFSSCDNRTLTEEKETQADVNARNLATEKKELAEKLSKIRKNNVSFLEKLSEFDDRRITEAFNEGREGKCHVNSLTDNPSEEILVSQSYSEGKKYETFKMEMKTSEHIEKHVIDAQSSIRKHHPGIIGDKFDIRVMLMVKEKIKKDSIALQNFFKKSLISHYNAGMNAIKDSIERPGKLDPTKSILETPNLKNHRDKLAYYLGVRRAREQYLADQAKNILKRLGK